MTLICITAGLAAIAEEPQLILEDDFERYNSTAEMRIMWQGTSVLELRAPGGGQAAIHDGGDANRRGDISVLPSVSHNVVLTADLFDFGTNASKRLTISLRNRSGAEVEMGAVTDGGTYAVRTLGFARNTDGWTAFDLAQKPVRGWHRFQAVISLSNTVATLDLDANGKADWTVTLTGAAPVEAFNQISFGGLSDRVSRGGPMLIDNVRLELVSVSPPALFAQPSDATPTPQPAVVTVSAAGSTGSNAAVGWIMGALAVIIALLAWLVLAFRRSGLSASTALVPAAGNSPSLTHQAALAELTAFAKQSLVQGLYDQRNALLDTQKKAEQSLIELEQRLVALHLPQQERIQAYEHRIAELEKELETRGEEVRELTQATLLLVRRKLEEEKGLGRPRDQFN